MTILDVILRTHSGPNVHPGDRVFRGPKAELILGCARSLARTLLRVDPTRYTVKLTVIDDHSDEYCVRSLKQILDSLPFETRFFPLSGRGVGAALVAAYSYARDHSQDLIYFVEDDYLHCFSALPEILEAQALFSARLGGREVAIFPVDYPDNYDPRWMKPSYVVLGPERHWHTDHSTTGTFFLSRNAFMNNIEHCMRLGQYMIDPTVHEGNTVNKIWSEGGVQLFSPLPSLAIHMQGEEHLPRYIDWRKWWSDYALPGPDLAKTRHE